MCVVAWSSTFALASPQDAAPPIAELLGELSRYERALHGLSFEVSTETSRISGSKSSRREFVSRNGRVRAWEGVNYWGKRTSVSATSAHLFAGKACADEGWVFEISRIVQPGRPPGEAGMTVVFFPPGTTGAISRSLLQGFIEDQSFAVYAQQCEVTLQSGEFSGVSVWVMCCDHPKLSSTTFFFDKEGLQLIGLCCRRVAGDEYGVGPIHVPSQVMPAESWVESTFGPIEYVTFEDRRVPIAIPFIGNSSEPNSRTEGVFRYKAYALLDRDLTSKIEFETIGLPDDGERVTSQGEEGIRYELRGGEVVKVIDADARRSAARARFHRSGALPTIWYLIGAVLAVGIVGFLAYRWSRRQ